ncbi:phosphatidylinositol transfer protein 2-like isoform X2 [Pyrus x bretschneideri]|uniref:phosphatidylinositol transfer protein 2-like isoform X2 n=1 Tax=Pyrus x bretschneideri TaxID=225117 RepID=UPI00202EC0BC|nr:phosphatidylinositol transfer protein 2-like isoform X2 [Pyrus x bretschneideri]
MVLMKEFRIVMPMSLEEYQVAQTYMVMKMQEQNTNSTEGVEIVESKSFEDDVFGKGHYSSKIYRLQSKAPSWLTTFAPADALIMQEEAWNAHPRLIKCPYFTKFQLTVETVNRADNGHSDNVHGLSKAQLATRDVETVDIASSAKDYWSLIVGTNNTDFSQFTSTKTGRGPLLEGWQDTSDPVMTAYKLVTIDAPYWGFGNKLERALLLGERALFLESHRNCFSWIDEWSGMTVEQIREHERERHRNSEIQELGRPTLVKTLEDIDQRLLPESEEILSGQRPQLST